MDVIAVDIGNSNVTVGAFKDADLGRIERVGHDELGKLAGVLKSLREFCGEQELGARTVPVVISSVNGAALAAVEGAVEKALDQRGLVIGREVPLPIKMAVEDPEGVGTDRLLTAAAAFDMLEAAVVVADFGTATTVDCVSHQGIFLGGAIMPGLGLAAEALAEHTEALPRVEVVVPEGDCGMNTVGAIQHGIYYGAIGALRQLVERYATQFGRWPQVVLTGGYAELIAKECDFADSVVKGLCLTGIYLTYVKYRAGEEDGEEQ